MLQIFEVTVRAEAVSRLQADFRVARRAFHAVQFFPRARQNPGFVAGQAQPKMQRCNWE